MELVKDVTEMRARVLATFAEAFPGQDFETREIPTDDVVITLPAGNVVAAVGALSEKLGMTHLTTITGDDMGDEIRLLYHMWHGCGLTLEVKLPLTDPRIATLTEQIPGATMYEREISDMFGVVFDGHPDLSRLLLPDSWDGPPPMLKSSDGAKEDQV